MREADILKNGKIEKQGNGVILNCRVEHEILAAFTLRTALKTGLLLHPIHLSFNSWNCSEIRIFKLSHIIFLAFLCYVGEKKDDARERSVQEVHLQEY